MGKYEEALERARAGKPLDEVFPELKESEDERIRKGLIEYLESDRDCQPCQDVSFYDDALAYLEKQKEQPTNEEMLRTLRVEYEKGVADTIAKYEQKEQKPVEIHIGNPNIQKFDPDVKVTTSDSSADGKELLYVSNKSYNIGFRDGVASVKPAEWSEEDEVYLQDALWCVEQAEKSCKDENDKGACWSAERWLKSLRPQSKAELTLLDENIINAAVAFVERNDHFNCWCGIDKHTVINALRSLKPHWKPSDEQMQSLWEVEDRMRTNKAFTLSNRLASLYNDLKKLQNE